jgi:NAD(P)-dependent dehydrogenase (short-subunit alcohol dehydrogenase family)
MFAGKTAVITGAGSGIGKALAEKAAAEGMHVALADINEAAVNEVAAQLNGARPGSAIAVRVDVSLKSDVEALAAKTMAAFGAIHLLVNNAGVGGNFSVLESSDEEWERVMGINLWGPINGCRVICPLMVKHCGDWGHVVNTAR